MTDEERKEYMELLLEKLDEARAEIARLSKEAGHPQPPEHNPNQLEFNFDE